MLKKFITNLGFLLFLNLVIKVVWIFGIEVEVQNVVGTATYGNFAALFNFAFILNIILDLGITNYNNRNIAQNEQLLTKHFSSLIFLRLFLGIIYAIGCLAIGIIIGYESEQLYLLIYIIINQFLASLILYFRSNIQGLHLFKTDSILSVLDRALMIIICGVLLYVYSFGIPFRIEFFIYCQTIAYSLTALIALLAVVKKTPFFKPKWNTLFFLATLKKSLPYAVLIALMSVYNKIDSVLLERLLPGQQGEEQVGIYMQAFRLMEAANMIPYLFAVLLLPIFARMLKMKEGIENLVKLSFSIIIVPAVLLVLLIWFYGTNIMQMYDQHGNQSAPLLTILMFSFIAICVIYIFGTLLTANGSLKHLNIIALTSIVINIIANLILIPKYQALGSAYASLLAQVTSAILQVILCIRLFSFKFNWSFLLRILLFIGVAIVLANLIYLQSFNWIIGSVLLFLGGIVLSILFGVLSLQQVKSIILSE